MDARLQKRIQRYGWDKASPFYESSWKEQLSPSQELLLREADLQSGQSVLDLAAGTGLVTFPAAEQVGPSGHVLATDISDKMVEYLASDAQRRGLSNIDTKQEDVEAIASEGNTFDRVLCSLGLMYAPDPLKATQEMARVAKPGGKVVASVWGRREMCGWAGIFPTVDARVETDVCPLFFNLGTGGGLEVVFEMAGLQQVVAHQIQVSLEYASPTDAIMAAFAGGPVALAYDKFDEQTRAAAEADYLTTIAKYKNGGGYSIPGEFVVVSGRKG